MRDRWKQSRGQLVALAYFDLLGKPLTPKELRRYGWGAEAEVELWRQWAREWRWVAAGQELYSLHSVNLVDIEASNSRMKAYWSLVRRRIGVLRWVPFVETVMVMNGLAHGVVNPDSDIDLFVVARPGRVWLVRGLMLLLLTLLGLRAKGSRKAYRLSPEFFVDTEHMAMLAIGSNSEYLTAFWLADFVPVLYPEGFRRFWSANSWIATRLPVAYRSPRQVDWPVLRRLGWVAWLERRLSGRLGDRMEVLAHRYQERIIQTNLRRLGERPDYLINDHIIKIHFNSRRPGQVDAAVEEFLAGTR